jgi:acetyl esterase/lipase
MQPSLFRASVATLFLIALPALAAPTPEVIPLWPDGAPVTKDRKEQAEVRLTVYRPEQPNGTAMVICPGGGYGMLVTKGEGSGIAAWLNQHGITGAVLEYRLPKGEPVRPLSDAQMAVRTLRARAGEFGCDPQRIGIIGFSAGGHLASTAATHFDAGDPAATDPVDRTSCRPDFAILIYPVITMGPQTHMGSKKNLLGKDPAPELIDLYSSEKQVTAKTPPTFLAHAADDRTVAPDNSLMYYDRMIACGVPSKYLKLPSGGHGLNGYKGPMWDQWRKESLEWLMERDLMKTQS